MLTRREYLAAGSAAVLSATAPAWADDDSDQDFDPGTPLPHKRAFFPLAGTYLNSASQHPLLRGARKAVNRYLDFKTFSGDSDYSNFETYQDVLKKFAKLINADHDEVCFAQSTTVGENLILKAIGFPQRGGRIVTDELHYVGSAPTYDRLAKEGVDVVTLRTTDGRIDLQQFETAITRETRLVSLSGVSMLNGFRHDLAGICEIAHARGALVYADLVQDIGANPVDVRATGVDFCATASYKWLMGEQGLGFMFARRDRLQDIERPWYGHYQLRSRRSTGFPAPEPAESVTLYEFLDSAPGYFAMGSQSNIVAAMLNYSLDYLLQTGTARIQAYRQPLIDRLLEELPRIGFESITPPDSSSALVSFRHATDASATKQKLTEANIAATVAEHHVRFSPSVFNDIDDIDQVLVALGV